MKIKNRKNNKKKKVKQQDQTLFHYLSNQKDFNQTWQSKIKH